MNRTTGQFHPHRILTRVAYILVITFILVPIAAWFLKFLNEPLETFALIVGPSGETRRLFFLLLRSVLIASLAATFSIIFAAGL